MHPKSPLRARAIDRPLRLLAALLAACTVAALGTGCGASSVVDPVASAATVSNTTPGYRMVFALRMSSPSLPITISATGHGSFDVREHSGSASFAFQLPDVPQVTRALGGSTLRMQEVVTDSTVYLKLPSALAAKLPGGRPWLKLDLAKQAATMGMPGLGSLQSASPLSSDPSQCLRYLSAVSGGVTTVGAARVAGYQTTSYRATIDLDKVADGAPAGNRAAVRRSVQRLEQVAHIKQLPVEVWIDSRHLVRQVTMSMNVSVAPGTALDVSMRIQIPQYGVQPAPRVPAASQVSDVRRLAAASPSA